MRQKSRESSNRYDQKKRLAKLAEIEEPSIGCDDFDEEENLDPLSLEPLPSSLSPLAGPSKNIQGKQLPQSSPLPGPEKNIQTKRVTRSTATLQDVTNFESKDSKAIQYEDEDFVLTMIHHRFVVFHHHLHPPFPSQVSALLDPPALFLKLLRALKAIELLETHSVIHLVAVQ